MVFRFAATLYNLISQSGKQRPHPLRPRLVFLFGGVTKMYGNPYMMQQGFQHFQQSFQQFPEIAAAVVPTINDVEQTRVNPGETKFVLVQNAPVLAIRVADRTGLNISTEYRKTEVFDPKAMQQQAEEAQAMTIQQLQAEMAEIKKQLGGLTGVKSSRKPEPTATDK